VACGVRGDGHRDTPARRQRVQQARLENLAFRFAPRSRLAAAGTAVDYAVTLREIAERDQRDESRTPPPMVPRSGRHDRR